MPQPSLPTPGSPGASVGLSGEGERVLPGLWEQVPGGGRGTGVNQWFEGLTVQLTRTHEGRWVAMVCRLGERGYKDWTIERGGEIHGALLNELNALLERINPEELTATIP